MNLIVSEDKKELEFILERLQNKFHNYHVLPFSLDVLIYCKLNNLNFINPLNYINNQFHKNILISSKELLDNLNYGSIETESQKKEYKNYIRKKYFQIYFTYNLISLVSKSKDVKKIFVSGWTNNIKYYFISNIVKEYFSNFIEIIEKNKENKISILNNHYEFSLTKFNSEKKKKILFTGQEYNLLRLIIVARLIKLSVYVISEKKNFNILNNLMKCIGVKYLHFEKSKKIEIKDFKLDNINFSYLGVNFSNLLNKSIKYINSKLTDTYFKSKALENILKLKKIDLVVSVIARGYQGSAIDFSKLYGVKTLGVSHGTISKSFDEYDKVYKETIAEGVYNKNYDYFPIQTNITFESAKNFAFPDLKLKTGNLIFAENNLSLRKKNKILYAVTNKNFNQMQFLGVELYFEFYKNLEILNKLGEDRNFEIIVNLHPSVDDFSFKNLKKLFKNLEFTKEKISTCLKKTFVTISFSSTVIEDSISSNIPVILFDNWKRYKHCDSEEDIENKSQPIYYVSNEKKLKKCIINIKQNRKVNFQEFKYGSNCFVNIYKLFKKIL